MVSRDSFEFLLDHRLMDLNRDIYTINNVHSPFCISRRRAKRNISVSTIPSDHSTQVELSDTSDEGEYDEFGRPMRAYVRTPSLPPPPQPKPKATGQPLTRRSVTPQSASLQPHPDPAPGLQSSLQAEDPDLLSEYLQDLMGTLDEPMPLLDLSAQETSQEELLRAVHEPLSGFRESALGAHDFLATLDQDQLNDLAPKLTRAVDIAQGVAPSEMHKPLSNSNTPTPLGIDCQANIAASTSQHLHSPAKSECGYELKAIDYSPNAMYEMAPEYDEQHKEHQQLDHHGYGLERETSITASVLDTELAHAMHSPDASPVPKALQNDPVESAFDVYQIFSSYNAAESSILSNAAAKGLPLSTRWRPSPLTPALRRKGASLECTRSCGYEVRLSDDTAGKWRVTSIEGAHEKACYPGYKGKKRGKKSTKKAKNISKPVGALLGG